MKIQVEKIQAALVDYEQKKKPFSGVIAVEVGGESVFSVGFGFANRSDAISNTPQTRFGLASIAKLFTGLAICQLVERGVLSFDTLLRECLDFSFPLFDPGIAIHHLLTHTSGVPDYFDEEVQDDYTALWEKVPMYRIREARDFLPLFQNGPMCFSPGERFKYSNSGFILLGLVVERVSGQRFTDYVAENILTPAGMADSGYFSLDLLPAQTAYGYMKDEAGNWRTNFYALPVVGGPDGGIFATVGDLSRLWDALLQHRLLSASATRLMLTPHVQVKNDLYYGYGIWIVQKNQTGIRFFAEGMDPGYSALSLVEPGTGVKISALSNMEDSVWRIVEGIWLP